jgi:acetyl esterase
LLHVCQNRKQLGVGAVVVGGESGGGNLAIALALKAGRDATTAAMIAGVYAMCPYISGAYSPAPPSLPSLAENAMC